jgi:hypothetical protein
MLTVDTCAMSGMPLHRGLCRGLPRRRQPRLVHFRHLFMGGESSGRHLQYRSIWAVALFLPADGYHRPIQYMKLMRKEGQFYVRFPTPHLLKKKQHCCGWLASWLAD